MIKKKITLSPSLGIITLIALSIFYLSSSISVALVKTPDKQGVNIDDGIPKNPGNRHCVSSVKVNHLSVYMIADWQHIAAQNIQKKWVTHVKRVYGSAYRHWHLAIDRKQSCLRIGFGNGRDGRVGTTVKCEISAKPCAAF